MSEWTPSGSPGAGAFVVLEGRADQGVTDNAPSFNRQLAALPAGGVAWLPPAPLPYGLGSDLLIPANVTLRGYGRGNMLSPNGQDSSALCPTVPGVGAGYTHGLVVFNGLSVACEDLAIYGGIGTTQQLNTVPNVNIGPNGNARDWRMSRLLVHGGSIGIWGTKSNCLDGDLLDVVVNGMTNTGLVAQTANGTQGPTTSVLLNSAAGVVPGMVALLYHTTNNADPVWVTSVVGSTVNLSAAITVGNGQSIGFYSAVADCINSSDCMITGLRTLSSTHISTSADTQYVQCHFSSPGNTTLPNVVHRINGANSCSYVGCTFDCGDGNTLALVQHISGSATFVGNRWQNGSAVTTFPLIAKQGINTTDPNALQLVGNQIPAVGTGSFSAMIVYQGAATGAQDVISGATIDAGAVATVGGLAVIGSGGTPSSVRSVNLGGVLQPEVSPVPAVTTPAVVSGTAFTPSASANSTVYVQTNAAAAGSTTITMGPSTGAENTIANAVAQVVGSDELFTLRVPAGWKVVVTVAGVTIGSVVVITGS